MKTTYVTRLFKVFLLTSILYSTTTFSQEQYKAQLNVIFETFITKDFQLLKPILKSQDTRLSNKEAERNLRVIAEQICLLPSPTSYSIVATETIGYDEKITVEYQYHNKVRFHYFTFDRKRKLIRLEVKPTTSSAL